MARLEWVHCLISGTDQLRPALEERRDILLTSSRGIHGPQMSEMALLHMLWLNRQAGRMHRNQLVHVWEAWEQRALDGKTVGIVGLGAIGERLARVCKALDMTVYGVSRTDRPVDGVDRVFDRSQLVDVAGQVDFLVLVLPRTADTEDLVDAEVLAAMRPTAFLVNLARGGVVDEDALLQALRDGRIAGAGLDVFATEPLPVDSPFWDLENVLVTPHVGGRSDRYGQQLLTIVEPNLRRYLAGDRKDMINVV
jgi:D-2-hydroxyacid dehydrogenase (NADP+)